VNLTSIKIIKQNSGLTFNDSLVFQGLNRLSLIDFDDAHITSLPAGLFANLPRLNLVRLNNNRVGTLPDDLFENSTRVEYFQMANTQLHRDTIVKIGEGHFGKNIKSLWISGNYIQLLKDDLFTGLPKLENLAMNDCGINYIGQDILNGTQVTHVNLDGNPILFIYENAFRDSKVSTFECNGCQLTSHVTFNGFLKKMPLRVIRLRNNNLTHVPKNAFRGLTKLFLIDLSNNSFATIEKNPYANLPNCYDSICIQLRNNPLNCDCNLAWLRTFANNIQGDRTLWKCARPRSVAGKSLVSIKIDEFCCENANSTKRCGSVPDPNNGWAVSAHMMVAILSQIVVMFGIPLLRA
jgi:Leucine-rich repeat (LRR) protein